MWWTSDIRQGFWEVWRLETIYLIWSGAWISISVRDFEGLCWLEQPSKGWKRWYRLIKVHSSCVEGNLCNRCQTPCRVLALRRAWLQTSIWKTNWVHLGNYARLQQHNDSSELTPFNVIPRILHRKSPDYPIRRSSLSPREVTHEITFSPSMNLSGTWGQD